MGQYRTILIAALVWATAIGAASDGAMILIENDTGIHILIVDPYGEVRISAGEQTTFTTIKPDDHIDFAVSTWAGMQIVDLVHITHRPEGKLATSR